MVDEDEERVAVAVGHNGPHLLPVPGRCALYPLLASAAREVGGLTRRERALKGGEVHPGHHEHLAGVPLLGDDRDESVVIEPDALEELSERGHAAIVPLVEEHPNPKASGRACGP